MRSGEEEHFDIDKVTRANSVIESYFLVTLQYMGTKRKEKKPEKQQHHVGSWTKAKQGKFYHENLMFCLFLFVSQAPK